MRTNGIRYFIYGAMTARSAQGLGYGQRHNIIYVWSYDTSVSTGSRLREKAKYLMYGAMTARSAQGLGYGQRQNILCVEL